MRFFYTLFLLVIFSAAQAQQNSATTDKASAFEVSYESAKVFPNPVTTTATFEFKIPSTSKVQVSLLNIIGAHIKSYINEVRAAGKQSVQFSVDELQRGTYFMRLSINGEVIKTVKVAVAPQ